MRSHLTGMNSRIRSSRPYNINRCTENHGEATLYFTLDRDTIRLYLPTVKTRAIV